MEKLLTENTELKEKIEEVIKDNKIIKETALRSQQLLSDFNTKADFSLATFNVVGAGSSTKVTKTATSSTNKDIKKQNIMAYFKEKCILSLQTPGKNASEEEIEDAKRKICEIIPKKELEQFYKDNVTKINENKAKSKKKDDHNKFIAGLIYANVIKDSKEKKQKLKSIKEAEEDANIVINPEITENTMEESEIDNEEVDNESIASDDSD